MLLLLLSACLVLCRASSEVRPNIVIFLADDLTCKLKDKQQLLIRNCTSCLEGFAIPLSIIPTMIIRTDVFLNKSIDGFDLWESLSKDLPSQRTKIVNNIDDIWGSASITVDNWKLHKGTNYGGVWDNWYGPDGREGTYDFDLVYKSKSAKAISKIATVPSKEVLTIIRDASTIKCDKNIPITPCKPLVAPCLYNINEDPCERRNLADEMPEILQTLLSELKIVNATAVPPINKKADPRADPKYWGRMITNYGDFQRLRAPPALCT